MAVVPFFRIVGQRAADETRSLTVPKGMRLPAGNYGFIEFYCDDPTCDCRRVILQVWRQGTGPKVWATITYGWETAEYYAKWSHWGPGAEADEMASATLEIMSPQTELSEGILDIFKEVLLRDEEYVARLKRHYAEACPGRLVGVTSKRKRGGLRRRRSRR